MTPFETLTYARVELASAVDLVSLLRLADAAADFDPEEEIDPSAARRAAMRLAEELKERAEERFEMAQRAMKAT